ncbi:MAG: hypothetical protein V2I25_07790 [Woeseiaceae bacterium]|jgi:hypothetical protein|nr:hypothetical protein [Woeseiaceae bacterium]
MGHSDCDRVMPVLNLQEYFRQSIDEAIVGQGVDIDPHATHYVVNMMTLFSRSEHFYEDDGEIYGIRPLALMLADAADAPSPEHRNQTLKRIGDVALFVAGFFVDSLRDKPVDVDYYMHMGENAYGSLSEETRGTFHGNAFADIYRELATKFRVLIDVLNEVRGGTEQDVVRTFEIWRKTGSQRAERLLREQGVLPIGARPLH